jgi:hypothetical protein
MPSEAFRDQVPRAACSTVLGLRAKVELVAPNTDPAHRLQGAPCRRRSRGLQGR